MGSKTKRLTYYKSVSNRVLLDNSFVKSRKVSTLLIPPRLVGYVKRRGASFLLERTLESQRNFLKTAKRINSDSAYTKYQSALKRNPKEHYVKINFRPKQKVWAQLRSLAIAHGVSMCYLFVILLEAYMAARTSEKQEILWQMKASLYLNTEKKTFCRELWITEIEKENFYYRKDKLAGSEDPPGPKIA